MALFISFYYERDGLYRTGCATLQGCKWCLLIVSRVSIAVLVSVLKDECHYSIRETNCGRETENELCFQCSLCLCVVKYECKCTKKRSCYQCS